MSFSYKYMVIIVALLYTNCRVPYSPQVKSTGLGYLVVEGYIDGGDTTTIQLSRTRTLADTSLPVPVTGAQIFVEDDQANSYPLTETSAGTYRIDQLSLNTSYRYRLHILTPDEEQYASAFVPIEVSPPIDNINWNIKNDGVQIYANTHNLNTNATRYYRWSYSETWEIHSAYYSHFMYVKHYFGVQDTVIARTSQVYQCWPTDNATNIILGSAAKLKANVIYKQPVTYIEDHDRRISVLYSILIRQYTLDTAGYNFWLAVKNNTENIGSIFDVQPGNVPGNVSCITHPAQTVIGYVGAGISYQYPRVFISNDDVPDDWNLKSNCVLKPLPVPNIKDSVKYYFDGNVFVPIDTIDNGRTIERYSASDESCVDCTLFGTNVKPDFWP